MMDKRISIAISALGGQGGGVLSNWIVELAEANGYQAQSTAIAGVAQRTGTTIYAIELFPLSLIEKEGKDPVLALMPVSGDVDICIAAELMEAGRAVNRGIVTPDRTTLIASDHRVYAISEKENMTDGRLNADQVRKSIREAAKDLILFDMNEAVLETSSVISSVLFGALAGSGALPFPKESYEATIKKSGRAIETNLAGFELGFQNAQGKVIDTSTAPCGQDELKKSSPMMERIETFPDKVRPIIIYGVHRLVDFQDVEYASLYLDRLASFGHDVSVDTMIEIARYLALWMGFEDVIRVADLKTREERVGKIASEVKAAENQIWYSHDYFHPRYEEFVDILPAGLGAPLSNSNFFRKLMSPFFSKGRIIRTGTISGYIMLRIVAGLRFLRSRSLRYKTEDKRIVAWLNLLKEKLTMDAKLAHEIAMCPSLIKGYGRTHERGINRFSRIMAFVEKNEDQDNLSQKVAELRGSATISEKGIEFNTCLQELNAESLTKDDAQKGEFAWAGSS